MPAPRLLLVDDEPTVLATTVRVLERLGYDVEAYADPMEAITAFSRGPQHYAAVIADVMTPTVSGPELVRQVREVRPGLPVILWTGFASLLDDKDGGLPDDVIVLTKPLSVARLEDALRRTVGAP